MSLRLRVALLTALITSSLMTVGVVVALNAFRADQMASIDALLDSQHQLLAQPALRAARLERPLLESLATEQLLTSASAVRLWDEAGEPLVEAGPDDYLATLPAAPGYSTVTGATGYRVISEELETRREDSVTLEVAFSLEEADTVYGLLRQRLRRLVLFGALLFGLAGWVAAAGALAPLARLRKSAEAIAGTEDLSRDLGGETGPREVRELAESFEAMLARLRRAGLEKEDALESARSFAAAAAHEMRTPLTSIGANLELLGKHPDTPDRDSVLEDAIEEHRRLVSLLESLRLLSRGDLTGPEIFDTVDLADIVARSATDARRRHPEAVIEVRAPDNPVMVQGWGEGLRLMIDNLITNAVTHGRKGTEKPQVIVGLDPDGVAVSVSDRGPGIEPANREMVLDRFTRGDNASAPGSGLGLALVVQQAELHGGSVEIGDTPGGGATVTVRMPKTSAIPHVAHRVPTD